MCFVLSNMNDILFYWNNIVCIGLPCHQEEREDHEEIPWINAHRNGRYNVERVRKGNPAIQHGSH